MTKVTLQLLVFYECDYYYKSAIINLLLQKSYYKTDIINLPLLVYYHKNLITNLILENCY